MRSIARSLAAAPLLALLAAVALPAAAQQTPAAPPVTDEIQARTLGSRWLPWLGCWELVADAVDYREVQSTGRRLVCVTPRLDGQGVNLTTQLDREVIADNTVIADDVERSLPEADCSGHQSATWSADGRRLHSAVRAACGQDEARTVAGLSMLIQGGRWLELQSVSLDGGEHRELVVRQYDRLDDEATRELGYATLDAALAVRAAEARAAAAAPLDVDDVLEATAIFPVELVEAAILESDSSFALDTNALVRLADAGIDARVIDLMVAVSFPEQFVVDKGPEQGGGGGYPGTMVVGYHGYGYYPSCWGAYYSPFYGPYGPGCGAAGWPGPYSYGYGYRPPYYGGGSIQPSVPPGGSLYGGRVLNRRGYVRPGSGGDTPSSSLSINPRADSSGLGYTLRRAVSRDGGTIFGGGSGGVRGKSGGSTAVSRSGGFSKPASAGGASSAGGSSSGGAKVRAAKPRGGGGGSVDGVDGT
jgi:hypothetical protein